MESQSQLRETRSTFVIATVFHGGSSKHSFPRHGIDHPICHGDASAYPVGGLCSFVWVTQSFNKACDPQFVLDVSFCINLRVFEITRFICILMLVRQIPAATLHHVVIMWKKQHICCNEPDNFAILVIKWQVEG